MIYKKNKLKITSAFQEAIETKFLMTVEEISRLSDDESKSFRITSIFEKLLIKMMLAELHYNEFVLTDYFVNIIRAYLLHVTSRLERFDNIQNQNDLVYFLFVFESS